MASALPTTNAVRVNDAQGNFLDQLSKISTNAVALVRAYMQDTPDKNKLIEGQEFTDQEVRLGILKAISDINTTSPTSVSFGNNTGGYPLGFLLEFTSINLAKMSINRAIRNDLQYTDGGITVDTDKVQKRMAWLNQQYSLVKEDLKKMKMSLNLDGIEGNLVSSYMFEFVRI
jgi:hypothetical protein